MPTRTIYVRDQDASLWQEFEQAALRRKTSASSLLAQVIRYWLDQQDYKA